MSVTEAPSGRFTTGQGKKIAVTGKGGSGKTMLTAIMTMLLARADNRKILTIDADSAVNLPLALGLEVKTMVSQIRRSIIEEPGTRAEIEGRHIRDVMAEAVQSGPGFDLLVMGRPEGPGCYCSVNDLLRYGIDSLSREYDVTLIDCEAGPEQVSRRVVQDVHVLIIMTDGSPRGMQSAGAIWGAARTDAAMRLMKSGLVVNRCRGDRTAMLRKAHEWNIEVLGTIPEDQALSEYDAEGKPLTQLPDASLSVRATEDILARLGL
jgi:CO dehydrogenase maturation factor